MFFKDYSKSEAALYIKKIIYYYKKEYLSYRLLQKDQIIKHTNKVTRKKKLESLLFFIYF
jgi:hypothetical protein